HEVRRTDGQTAAFVEVDDGDAVGCPIHDVRRDQRALEDELRVDGSIAGAQALVPRDLHVRSAVGANGGEGAVADHVTGNDNVSGPEDIDAVAPLSGAAEIGTDAL